MNELLYRVIEAGIKRPIRLLIENRCLASALVLIYSGIEMMAFLAMAEGKRDLMRSDFIVWAEKFVAPSLRLRLSGKDLYGARCSVLRGTDSRLVREGSCRLIRYQASPGDATVVSTEELAQAFFNGIDRFLGEALRNEQSAALLNQRLEEMLKTLPF